MPYARQWEAMTKTTITGATHSAPIIFAILVFYHSPMAEVPNQEEDLGHGAQPCHLLVLTLLVLSLVYIAYAHICMSFLPFFSAFFFGPIVCILAFPSSKGCWWKSCS